MANTARAVATHDEMFPGRVSQLRKTDPDLVDVFNDFALDEILDHGDLEPRVRLLTQLASLMATNSLTEYKVIVSGALQIGVRPVEIKELTYQAVPYLGMGQALDFIHATNEALRERDVPLPLPTVATTTRENRHHQGLALMERLLGAERLASLWSSAPEGQRHVLDLLAGNCFGDYVSRGGLDLRTRELITLAFLVSLGGCESQVASHVEANLRVGNDRQQLVATLTHLIPFLGYPRVLNGLRAVAEASV